MKPLRCTPTVALNIREGRQTQDRRPVKLDGYEGDPVYETSDGVLHDIIDLHPFSVGDVLYVREAWRVSSYGDLGAGLQAFVKYKDDYLGRFDVDRSWLSVLDKYYQKHKNGKFSPNQHMFKEFARTFLTVKKVWVERTVKKVWVERIQDMSEEDAKAEGICLSEKERKSCNSASKYVPKFRFNIWEKLYDPDAWKRNGWVWVSKFEINKELTK